MSWRAWHDRPRRGPHHGHGYQSGPFFWGGPDYRFSYGYEYYPSNVYYAGETYFIEAANAGRLENIGAGVSWSAALIGARAYLANNPPLLMPGTPGPWVRIRSGGGALVCEWEGSPRGWVQRFCQVPSSWGYDGLGAAEGMSDAQKSWLAVLAVIVGGAVVAVNYGK